MRGRISLVLLSLAAACGTPGFGGDDVGGASNVSIGFTQTALSGDETESEFEVFVTTSEPPDHTVTATLSVSGTATEGEDFTIASGPFVILFPGVDATFFVIQVFQDNKPEPEETIELHLTNVDGATVDNGTFTYTIRNNLLPRIEFDWPSSVEFEPSQSSSAYVKVLPPSPVPITFDLALGGTATSDDFVLPSLPITIPAGAESVEIPIGHVDDDLDEDNETLIMTLVDPVNAIVGAVPTHTHVIEDEDQEARVSFSVEKQTVSEGNSGTTIVTATAQLDRVVGRTLSVPFTVNAFDAVAGTDFAVLTQSPLIFQPGTTSQTISVAIYGDTTLDGSGDIRLELEFTQEAPTGWPWTQQIIVATDDCVGTGNYAFCPDKLPTTTRTFNDSVSSDGTFSCAPTQPPGWIEAGNLDTCFIYARDIVINSARVMGSRPVVFFATNSITVNTLLEVGSHNDSYASGAGSQPSSLCAPIALPAEAGAGGAGGSFVTAGGSGGSHGQVVGGQPAAASGPPARLRGGCTGQYDDSFASPGRGGGAVYLFSMGSITIAPGATVNASGGPGQSASYSHGGSGGGSGGMIVLSAPTIQATSARFLANGGGGSEGSPANGFSIAGGEVDFASPTTPAAGGAGTTGGDGGAGAAQGAAAGSGASANNNNGGGGGGGGLGYILTSQPLTGALASPTPVPL